VTRCNTLQHTATHCNTLQHAATHYNTLQKTTGCHEQMSDALQHTATCVTDITHCNTLQHTATHCNTLQHTATHCNTLQHTATCVTDITHRMTHVTHIFTHAHTHIPVSHSGICRKSTTQKTTGCHQRQFRAPRPLLLLQRCPRMTLSASGLLYIYIYMYIYMCIYSCVYIYMYIYKHTHTHLVRVSCRRRARE